MKIEINKTLFLIDLKIVLATREFARFAMQTAVLNHYQQISLKDVDSISRSFLGELCILSAKNNIDLIDVPATVQPLLEIIQRSHRDQVMYAPKIKVRISDKTFA